MTGVGGEPPEGGRSGGRPGRGEPGAGRPAAAEPDERGGGEYRIDDLARHSGTTVRTIRAYQDRGLLPRVGRRGRANVYDDSHLTRLRQISVLLERGYTLASIKELLAAWDEGRGLSGVLGLVSEIERPWSDEEPERLTFDELDGLFGGGSARGEDAVAEAVELGVLVPLPERPGEFLVPSPQELAVAAELHRAGVPLLALTGHLRELRAQVEHIAARFMDFTGQYIFGRCPHSGPTDEEASEAAGLVRRLRPLAKQTVDAELARAMRTFASRSLREHLRRGAHVTEGEVRGQETGRPGTDGRGAEGPGTEARAAEGPGTDGRGAAPEPPAGSPGAVSREPSAGSGRPARTPGDARVPGDASAGAAGPALIPGAALTPGPALIPGAASAEAAGSEPAGEPVQLPAATVAAVRALVGADQAAAFIASAAEREVHARTMDRLATGS